MTLLVAHTRKGQKFSFAVETFYAAPSLSSVLHTHPPTSAHTHKCKSCTRSSRLWGPCCLSAPYPLAHRFRSHVRPFEKGSFHIFGDKQLPSCGFSYGGALVLVGVSVWGHGVHLARRLQGYRPPNTHRVLAISQWPRCRCSWCRCSSPVATGWGNFPQKMAKHKFM